MSQVQVVGLRIFREVQPEGELRFVIVGVLHRIAHRLLRCRWIARWRRGRWRLRANHAWQKKGAENQRVSEMERGSKTGDSPAVHVFAFSLMVIDPTSRPKQGPRETSRAWSSNQGNWP